MQFKKYAEPEFSLSLHTQSGLFLKVACILEACMAALYRPVGDSAAWRAHAKDVTYCWNSSRALIYSLGAGVWWKHNSCRHKTGAAEEELGKVHQTCCGFSISIFALPPASEHIFIPSVTQKKKTVVCSEDEPGWQVDRWRIVMSPSKRRYQLQRCHLEGTHTFSWLHTKQYISGLNPILHYNSRSLESLPVPNRYSWDELCYIQFDLKEDIKRKLT